MAGEGGGRGEYNTERKTIWLTISNSVYNMYVCFCNYHRSVRPKNSFYHQFRHVGIVFLILNWNFEAVLFAETSRHFLEYLFIIYSYYQSSVSDPCGHMILKDRLKNSFFFISWIKINN